MLHDGFRQSHAVTADNGQSLGRRGHIGDRRAGGNKGRIVAGHVGNDQADDPRRCSSKSQPPTLDARDMLAHHIHRRDRRAGRKQGLVDGNFVSQGQTLRRRGQQRRATTGHQRHHQIVRCEPLDQPQQLRRSGKPSLVRHRMGRLQHADALAHGDRTMTRNDSALQWPIPQAFERRCHLACRLACADDDRAPFRLFRQVGTDGGKRIGCFDGRLKQARQEGTGVSNHQISLQSRNHKRRHHRRRPRSRQRSGRPPFHAPDGQDRHRAPPHRQNR